MAVWKDTGFTGYEISDFGTIRSTKGYVIRELRTVKKLYESITISDKGIKAVLLIHRLVAIAFIPNPDNKPQVNHIDGNKLNNRVENLEWVTVLENQCHAQTNRFSSNKSGVGFYPKTGKWRGI